MASFGLTWTPSGSASTQTVQYRVKNITTWTTVPGIAPANPQSAANAAATVSGLADNTVYQFQIISNCCPGVQALGDVMEGVKFVDEGLTTTPATGSISVAPTIPHADLDYIDYDLVDNVMAPVDSISTSWANANQTFTALASGTYYVKYRYGAIIDGSPLYSDDPTQQNQWFMTSGIIVP